MGSRIKIEPSAPSQTSKWRKVRERNRNDVTEKVVNQYKHT